MASGGAPGDIDGGDSGPSKPGDAQADASAIGPSTSCKERLALDPASPNGVYPLDPDGEGPAPAVPVACDMQTDGGGWTLALLKNSISDGDFSQFASNDFNLEALATTPEEASSSSQETPALTGWINLNTFPYAELRLAGYRNGVQVYTTLPIAKSLLRIPFGQSGYYLYDAADGYYWCGGASTFTNDGTGQSNQPTGAPSDCKGHTALGNGWDFGTQGYNQGLTVCGGGSALMTAGPTSGYIPYGAPGAAQAFWVR